MYDKKMRKAVFAKLGGHCAYCGIVLDYDNWEIEHVKPRSKGGSDRINNLLPSCIYCNRLKRDMKPLEFKEYLENKIVDKFFDVINSKHASYLLRLNDIEFTKEAILDMSKFIFKYFGAKETEFYYERVSK